MKMTEHELEYVWIARCSLEQYAPAGPTKDRTIKALEDLLRRHGWNIPDKKPT